MVCRNLMKFAAVTLLVLGALCLPGHVRAAVITIVNADGPNEGFNDANPVAPVGGNDGTTLGAQRLIAFQHAADIWGLLLESNVEIFVDANFDPLFCTDTSAVVGSAGANSVHRDFPGAEYSNTWYLQALANSLATADLWVDLSDMGITLNSTIDNNDSCLENKNWYLGLDGNNGNDIDVVDVVVHEIGHGLGFATYVDEQTGRRFFNFDDIFMKFLEDHSRDNKLWSNMNNNQRKQSAKDTGDLHWVGENVVGASGGLSAGVHPTGHVEMYAPNPVEPGSSVSHWSDDLYPDESMEPFVTDPPIHDPGLAFELMLDIGWTAGAAGGPECGNEIVEAGEECEGNDLGGISCVSLGFASGTVVCDASCNFDTSSCTAAVCGNDIIEGSEVCDGGDLGGATCENLGFAGGTLTCHANCNDFNTTACSGPTCKGHRDFCSTGSECCSGNCKRGECKGN